MKKTISYITILLISIILTSFTKLKDKNKLITFKYYCVTNSSTAITAMNSGDWNNNSTWSNNQIPSNLDHVIIPSNITITLSGTIHAHSIRIDGTIKPINLTTDFNITTKGIMIHDDGLLEIGSEENPYVGKGVITLTGSDPSEELMSSHSFMGSKLIGVMSGGRLELHGVYRKSWTQLNKTALAGTNTITLKETINWEIGDEIVIASTDFDPHQAEKRTITAINGLIITLDSPLNYMHFGIEQIYNNGTKDLILDERAEVGLLSHNLKIQGDDSSESNGFGGHIMSMPGSISKASNIELYRMGQKSQLGKYPWHWHLLGDADGQYIKNSGIHTSYNRVITVHGTNNTVVEGNVGYDFLGHGYFLENGSETGNLFKNNLGVLCKRPVDGEETTPHDIGIGAERGAHPEAFPATFWITNPNNDFIGNVSAGSDGSGFWHLILDKVLDGAESAYIPGIQPMGMFDDNKAHSNLFSWGVDGGVDRDSDEIVNGHYRPQNANGSQFTPIINRFDGYKSVDRNVWIRANTMDFYDCDFGDNGRADFFSYNQTLYNSLIVGKSANIGNPTSASELEAGRSLPYADKAVSHFDNGFRGHSIYDGPSGIIDTHFDGFNSNGAKSYCFQINGASRKSTNHFARGITFGPDVEENVKFDFDHLSYFSYMYLSGLIDQDGSLTGVAGTNVRPIIIDNPGTGNLFEKGANTQMTDVIEKPEWGAWLTQNKTYNYFKDTDFTNKDDGAFTPRYFITEYPDKTSHAAFNVQTQQLYFDAPIITNDLDYIYYFQYHKLPTFMIAEINGTLTNSESVIVAYPNIPGIAFGGNATRVTNFTELKESATQAYLYKDNTFYFKHISNLERGEIFQRQFGSDYKYESRSTFICIAGNCSDSSKWGNIIDKITLIDYSARSFDLGSVETSDDSRDNTIVTDNLNVPNLTYSNKKVNFSVHNNGNGVNGYTDYEINLSSRQVWENFNTLGIDYTGPDVEVLIGSENGTNFNVGTYSSDDISNIRIGQDNHFDKFTNVNKLTLRFHEENIGNINTVSTANVSINSINLGLDIPDNYSVSSTFVNQDSDGDGVLDEDEIDMCRDANSASDFALEFNSDSTLFNGYEATFLDDLKEENGVLKGISNGSDPKIIKSSFVSFQGNDVDAITFRYKANRSSTRVQLFWSTTENNGFNGVKTIFKNYTGNGDWQEIVLDLSSNTDWKGKTITGFRIDPTNNTDTTFEIDWIRANNAKKPSECSNDNDDDGDGLSNLEEDELCRDANSASDFALEFNGDDIFENYEAQQINNLEEINGVIKGISSGNDPKIFKSGFLNMSGLDNSILKIKIKANTLNSPVQLFWETTENSGYSGTRSLSVNYTGNGSWQELEYNFASNSQWTNKTISGLRLDPTNQTNISFEIDWIRAVNAKDPENSCDILSIDNIQNIDLMLYPNPVLRNNNIYIKGLNNYNDIRIYAYDVTGKQINIDRDKNKLNLLTSKTGVYFFKIIINDTKIITQKIIVK